MKIKSLGHAVLSSTQCFYINYLFSHDILSLSCVSKEFSTLFKDASITAKKELYALQNMLRFENDTPDLDNLFEKSTLKFTIKLQILSILNLLSAYKHYTQSWLTSYKKYQDSAFFSKGTEDAKTWPVDCKIDDKEIQICKMTIARSVLCNNVLGLLQAYTDLFSIIQRVGKSIDRNRPWDNVSQYAITHVGTAQKQAGKCLLLEMQKHSFTPVILEGIEPRDAGNVPSKFEEYFIDENCKLGESYYLVCWGNMKWREFACRTDANAYISLYLIEAISNKLNKLLEEDSADNLVSSLVM